MIPRLKSISTFLDKIRNLERLEELYSRASESPSSWRWTTVTWRVLNFPCRFAVGYQLEDRNVGKNPISHSISCPVREIQPRTGATLQETLVGESASISATPVYHLMTTPSPPPSEPRFFPPFIDLDQRYPFDRGSHLSCNRLSWRDRIPSRLYIVCTYIYTRGKFGKRILNDKHNEHSWFFIVLILSDNRENCEENEFWLINYSFCLIKNEYWKILLQFWKWLFSKRIFF